MKSTGIVRRLDDLGRIVIPKEIRRTLRIREGDPLELYTEGDAVMFKKYSPLTYDIELLNRIFRAITESYDSLPDLLLVDGSEVMCKGSKSKFTKLIQDVRDIGVFSVFSGPSSTIESVDTEVTDVTSQQTFEVRRIKHVWGRDKDYIASLLIGPGTLDAVNTGVINTLAAAVTALCE